jgi:hypothetical protein
MVVDCGNAVICLLDGPSYVAVWIPFSGVLAVFVLAILVITSRYQSLLNE